MAQPFLALRWRRIAGLFLLTLFVMILLVVALSATTVMLLRSENGRLWLIDRVNQIGIVHIGSLKGDLTHEVLVTDFAFYGSGVEVAIDTVGWTWRLSELRHRKLTVYKFDAGNITVRLSEQEKNTKKKSSSMPDSLSLPIEIELVHAGITSLKVGELIFDNIQFSGNSTKTAHWINLLHLGAEQGEISGAIGLSADAPFAAGGNATFRGNISGHDVGFDVNLDGSLIDLATTGYIFADQWFVTLNGRFNLFAPDLASMLREVVLRADHINPAKIIAGLPNADISAMLTLEPPVKDQDNLVRGDLMIENAIPGLMNERRLPIRSVKSSFELFETQLVIYELSVLTTADKRDASVNGNGWLRQDDIRLEFSTDHVNPNAFDKSLPGANIKTHLMLTGDYQKPKAAIALADDTTQLHLDAEAEWSIGKNQIVIDRLSLSPFNKKGVISLSGQYALDKNTLTIQGKSEHFDLSQWANTTSDINGTFSTQVWVGNAITAETQINLTDSQIAGFPVKGDAGFQFGNNKIHDIVVALTSGASHLTAKGSLPLSEENTGDAVTFNGEVFDLGTLAKGARGHIALQGLLTGTVQKLNLSTELNAVDLSLNESTIKNIHGEVKAALFDTLPFNARVTVDDLTTSAAVAAQTELIVEGTAKSQQANLKSSGVLQKKPYVLSAMVKGTVEKNGWSGALHTFNLESFLPVKLLSPMPIELADGQVTLSNARVSLDEILIQMQSFRWHSDYLFTEGQISNVELGRVLKLAGINAKRVHGNLNGAGTWTFLQEKGKRKGAMTFDRQSGDIAFLSLSQNSVPVQLSLVHVRADIDDAKVVASGAMESARFGKILFDANTVIPQNEMPALTALPFNLKVNAEVPDLLKASSAIINDVKLNGSLAANFTHTGAWQGGKNEGALIGNELSLNSNAAGVALGSGKIDVRLNDREIAVKEFTLTDGRGKLEISGGVDLSSGSPVARLKAVAERMRVIQRSDMQLVVSGKGDLSYDQKGIALVGGIKTLYGNIQYRDTGVPALSDDVVVIGEDEENTESTPLNFSNLDFDIDLGDHFRLKGYGVDTRLTGVIKLHANASQPLSALGTIKTEEGTYRAYGQRLEIREGILSFVTSISDPTLKILAVRENSQVNAGVSVSGTASRPKVSLYSDPAMNTNEQLSWLLFDHGTESIDKSDSSMLIAVLNEIMSGGDGNSFFENFLGGIVDEVGMTSAKTSDGETTQVVTVNKRLTKNISVGLEKSFNGLQDAIRLSFKLSKQWSLIGRIGTDDQTVDVRYSVRFN
ncbi:MAG: translocation/assembly module TamB domain-containing protein [Burkholderiales bacterium]|jgi:translocation and assembly module TamB|nr:translocation/assembly module TamB domain-containing protein [Burkholderiales bacterium]